MQTSQTHGKGLLQWRKMQHNEHLAEPSTWQTLLIKATHGYHFIKVQSSSMSKGGGQTHPWQRVGGKVEREGTLLA